MKHPRFPFIILIVLIPILFLNSFTHGQDKPKFVVGIVVDQMRYDYLTRFADYFGEGGFKKLMNEGSFFTNAHFNYVPTVTAAGHSSVYTGTTPFFHGIISNSWYDKFQKKSVGCVDDTTMQTVGANDNSGRVSPHRLLARTITDQLKIYTNGNSKVISMSIKDRGAVLPGGRTADGAYWYDEQNGNFITSTYYMQQLPEWVNNFNNKKLPEKYSKESWTLSLPIENYKNSFPDEAPWEKDVFSEGKTSFPHDFTRTGNKLDAIISSPWGNQLLIEFAKSAVENEKLGSGINTDFLAISFSSTDYVGHEYGPNSVEVMDLYIQFDRQIAELLNYLDDKAGKGNYLLFLSADHGVGEAEGYLKENRLPYGALGYSRSYDSLKAFASREFGSSDIIENYSNYQVFLNYKFMSDNNLESPVIEKKFADYLRFTFPEISMIYTRNDMKGLFPSREGTGLILNGFNPVRSGDISFQLLPGYLMDHPSGNAATHSTVYSYDTHVPILFYGWHVPAEKSNEPVYIVDIAATVASLIGINEPDCSIGKPLIKLKKEEKK